MTTVQVNGTELYYEERGSGPPLLLMHGTGAYADLWTPVMDGLARSYRVIAYDRRGHGRSSAVAARHIAEHAADAAALLQMLDAAPATIVGWSGGGAIALGLAASSPELVAELVLAEPAVHMLTHPTLSVLAMQTRASICRYVRRDAGAAAQVMYRWASGSGAGGNTFDTLPQAWQDQMTLNGPTTVREMDQLMMPYPSKAAIRAINCPVTIIEGELSDSAFKVSDAFVQRLLPNARVIRLPGAAHFLHIDQPDLWVEALAPAS
jgi:pimeloyl-ACP methyl ester carboxylesterase